MDRACPRLSGVLRATQRPHPLVPSARSPHRRECRALQATPTTDALLPLLSTLLDALEAVSSLPQRSARGTHALLLQLAVQAACAWRGAAAAAADGVAAAGEAANNLLAAHASAPPEVVAALTSDGDAAAAEAAAAAAQEAGGDLDAALAVLRGRQEALGEELEAAADLLRFWGRRGEKAAAGSEGARGGREGDVPPMMAQVGGRAGGRHGRGAWMACAALLALGSSVWSGEAIVCLHARPPSHPRARRRSSCCGAPATRTRRSRRRPTCARGSWCANGTGRWTCPPCRHACAAQGWRAVQAWHHGSLLCHCTRLEQCAACCDRETGQRRAMPAAACMHPDRMPHPPNLRLVSTVFRALQAHADQYSDGERLAAQQAVTFEQEFVALRGRARAAAHALLQGAWPRDGRGRQRRVRPSASLNRVAPVQTMPAIERASTGA